MMTRRGNYVCVDVVVQIQRPLWSLVVPEGAYVLLESGMTKQLDFKAFATQGLKSNRSSGGGRGISTDPSQEDVLGLEGLEFIRKAMKGNAVKALDFMVIGSEFFRKENIDFTLAKKARSAKKFSKVTVVDLEIKFVGDTVRRLSDIVASITTEAEAAEAFAKMTGFGQVIVKNEQFKCEWPLGEAVKEDEGDPMATDLAPILAPWSLFIEACEKYAVQ